MKAIEKNIEMLEEQCKKLKTHYGLSEQNIDENEDEQLWL